MASKEIVANKATTHKPGTRSPSLLRHHHPVHPQVKWDVHRNEQGLVALLERLRV